MEYIANPVKVTAQQIIEIASGNYGSDVVLRLDDGSSMTISASKAAGMTARYNPVPGDYVVTQEDGYVYFNPREVFERKYHPVDSKVHFAADREIASFLRDAADRVLERGGKAELAVVITGTYGSEFYVESSQSAVEALGVMEIGKATMMNAIIKDTLVP